MTNTISEILSKIAGTLRVRHRLSKNHQESCQLTLNRDLAVESPTYEDLDNLLGDLDKGYWEDLKTFDETAAELRKLKEQLRQEMANL